jgi:hypothetical protein
MAQAELIKFAAALNGVVRAIMHVQDLFPDEELFGEIQDMHHWLMSNMQLNLFGNLTDFIYADLSQINLMPVNYPNPNRQVNNP